MITYEDIEKAQAEWAHTVVRVGRLMPDRTAFEAAAAEAVDRLYAYDAGEVLFKPTKAADAPFRTTRDGAISYFVGGGAYPEDGGFALNPWTDVRFHNQARHISGDRACVMGHYWFTDPGGEELKVEYTFGYMESPEGLKIFLHHSSLPFIPGNGSSAS